MKVKDLIKKLKTMNPDTEWVLCGEIETGEGFSPLFDIKEVRILPHPDPMKECYVRDIRGDVAYVAEFNFSVAHFSRGQILGPTDLSIVCRKDLKNIDPYYLKYAIYDKTTGVENLIAENFPEKIDLGRYYARYTIPINANMGTWVIRWTVQDIKKNYPPANYDTKFEIVADSKKSRKKRYNRYQLLKKSK